MNTHLRSDNIFLRFGDDYSWGGYDIVNELWKTLRRTAVEPGQSSSPDFASFADECLLCSQIVIKGPTASENENESLWDPSPLEQASPSSPSTALAVEPPPGQIAGLIYLYAGPANLPAGEANIGVITESSMQRRGYAREAVQLVLRWAFEELKFHRVQAPILDTPDRDRAMRLFIGSGFAHEGTRRRAIFQPEGEGMAGLWKDVTYLAMLDTDWTLKSTWVRANRPLPPPVPSAWDEMFARHAREREELLQWEEKHGRIRRSLGTETLK
ncbi:acyl-CoA N-acyltransferase, partial [Imleria badia]